MNIPARIATNPYVGPRAFRPGETLYGRDRESDEFLDLLTAERLVILHAPSGAGKTSLLNASVVDKLKAEKFNVLPIARVKWRPIAAPPSQGYNPYLYSAMLDLSRDPAVDTGEHIEQYETEHAPHDMDLHRFLTSDLEIPAEALQVLIFDQFEELLTLDANDTAGKHAFCRELGRILRSRARFAVFSMREDFVGALEPYLGHFSTRLAARYRLNFLSPEAASVAIRRPVEPNVKYDDDAVERLVSDLRRVRVQLPGGQTEERPGAVIEPVHLQVVCTRIWNALPVTQDKITFKDVEKLGNVDRALRGYYADSVGRAAKEGDSREADVRYWIENQLIVNRLRAQTLMGSERESGVSAKSVEVLENTYVIRRDQRRGAVWYELAHDRLVIPVLTANDEWQDTAGDWLESKAIKWRESGKDPGHLLKLRKFFRFTRTWGAMTAPQRQRIEDFVRSSRKEWLTKLLVPIILVGTLFVIGLAADNAETRSANRGQKLALDSANRLLTINARQSESLMKVVDSLTSVRARYAWGLDSGSSQVAVQQSVRANQALQTLVRETTPAQRGQIVIRYYEKRRDKQRVEFALRDLGYEVEVRGALAKIDEPTNSVAYGPGVPFRDLKLIALTLVRGGTELRSICPVRDVGDRGNVVEVNYSSRAASQPTIELAEINALASRKAQVNCAYPVSSSLSK